MKFIATTFSPSMLGEGVWARVKSISLDEAKGMLDGAVSAVGHEVTAKVLSALLGRSIAFDRRNLSLRDGDEVIVVIPSFRAEVAREFTKAEVEAAGFRCFRVEVIEVIDLRASETAGR